MVIACENLRSLEVSYAGKEIIRETFWVEEETIGGNQERAIRGVEDSQEGNRLIIEGLVELFDTG